jgi:hypothetical protein
MVMVLQAKAAPTPHLVAGYQPVAAHAALPGPPLTLSVVVLAAAANSVVVQEAPVVQRSLARPVRPLTTVLVAPVAAVAVSTPRTLTSAVAAVATLA